MDQFDRSTKIKKAKEVVLSDDDIMSNENEQNGHGNSALFSSFYNK
jgi:hypothetical protein